MAFRPTTLLAPIALAALLGGCAAPGTGNPATGPAGSPNAPAQGTSYSPMQSDTPASDCDSDGVQKILGQPYSDSVGETVRQRSGSRVIRLLRPGQVMTMEYEPSRINIILDAKGAIQALRCG